MFQNPSTKILNYLFLFTCFAIPKKCKKFSINIFFYDFKEFARILNGYINLVMLKEKKEMYFPISGF